MSRHTRRGLGGRRAFTLIELLVVVAIIALLISILLPSLAQSREQARRAQCAAHMHQMGIGLSAYSADSKQFLPIRGGYAYNIKETEEYHWVGGSKTRRMPVNYGALFRKYCGGDGMFYYCPANTSYFHADQRFGWPSFQYDTVPPANGVSWGGFMYAVPAVPGTYPKDDLRLSFKIDPALVQGNKSPSSPVAPDGYGGLYDSRYVRYPPPYEGAQGYIQVALRQTASFSRPYMGRSLALMTDMLLGTKAHKAAGFNVLFTDYHAKWVSDKVTYLKMYGEGKPLSQWNASSGNTKMPPERMGMWNVLSSKP